MLDFLNNILFTYGEENEKIVRVQALLFIAITFFVALLVIKGLKLLTKRYKLKNPESLIKDFQKVVKKWEKIYSKVDRTSEEAIYKTLNSKLFSKINLNKHGL